MSLHCPNCHHEEIEGAFYCSECATKLFTNDDLFSAKVKRYNEEFINTISNEINLPIMPQETNLINLQIVKSGQILSLEGKGNYSIGRISIRQAIFPDVDLTPFEAFSQGVSRLHAIIQIQNKQISISDLGSSNGTWINKIKLNPHKYTTISNSDIITLGKFKIQAIIRQL